VTLLARESKKLGVSESAFVSKMLKRDLLIWPLVQNLEGIGLSRSLFQEIISRMDSISLEILGSEIARRNLPIVFDLLGWDLNLTSIFRFMKEILEAIGWFKIEFSSSENHFECRIIHNYGYRWSMFLKSCLSSMFEFIRSDLEIAISEKAVKLRIAKRPSFDKVEGYELSYLA
jgi:hypothetical protein